MDLQIIKAILHKAGFVRIHDILLWMWNDFQAVSYIFNKQFLLKEDFPVDQKPDPHTHNRRCALPEPYPEPRVTAPNLYFARLLLEDYCGGISEMTAINQYLYHSFTFQSLPELAELEECISIIEMKHVKLLAETIQQLGLAPEFRVLSGNLPVYWSASSVYYGYDINDKLDADIAAEIQAIENYRLHQRLIDDPFIKKLLERIIIDEEYHVKLFRDAKAKYCRRG